VCALGYHLAKVFPRLSHALHVWLVLILIPKVLRPPIRPVYWLVIGDGFCGAVFYRRRFRVIRSFVFTGFYVVK
jgi:hypothetical protein